jgi:hypothetical protein
MSRVLKFVGAVSVSAIAATGFQALPAHATAPATTSSQALLVGKLGFEGGPYPGGFHPTAGSVDVEFSNPPLVLVKQVGLSGYFRIPLGPGTYTVIGCGPSTSPGSSGLCGRPKSVTLTAGEVDHIRLVWAYAP